MVSMRAAESERVAARAGKVSDLSGGTTHKRISRRALGRLRLRVPAVEERTAIATILSDIDAEIAALEAKLAKTRMLKEARCRSC